MAPFSPPSWVPTGLAVALAILAIQSAVPGHSQESPTFGRNKYIEYRTGDLPIIISAPHGGTMTPAEIPDRATGTMTHDTRTAELAEAADTAIYQLLGRRAHIVICRLSRTKVDANRDSGEGVQGNPYALQAWREFHAFIDSGKKASARKWGAGLYIDVHAHGHDLQRVELGYQLTADQISEPDAVIEAQAARSSIRTLSQTSPSSFAELLRGKTSFGGLMHDAGFAMIPSPVIPAPAGTPYFNGGYNTARHGSRNGGPISGFQMETNWTAVRDSPASRKQFAQALARSLKAYFAQHFRMDLDIASTLLSPVVRSRHGQGAGVEGPRLVPGGVPPTGALNMLGISQGTKRLAPGVYINSPAIISPAAPK